MTLIRSWLTHPARRAAEARSSAAGMHRVAPSARGVSTSRRNGSCDSPDTQLKRSAAFSPNVVMCQSTK